MRSRRSWCPWWKKETVKIMKKFIKLVFASFLFLVSLVLFVSAVFTIIDSFDNYYPLTSMFPTLFFISLGTFSLLSGLYVLSALKLKKRYLLIGLLIVLCLLALTKPFNKMVINSWDKYIALTYDGVDTVQYTPYTKITTLNYTLENLSNRHLKDVVVVFTCRGYDGEGNEVIWDSEYVTHRDIAPHNKIDISVGTFSLEVNDYSYWDSEVKFVAFEK